MPDTHAARLAAHFGLNDAAVLHEHVGYRGTRTVHLQHSSGSLFLRRYAEHWRERADQVAFEVAWLDLLSQRGLPVVTPLRAVDGRKVVLDDGLPVAAFSPLEGTPRFPLSPSDAATFGQIVAEVHAAPSPPATEGVFRYDLHALLDAPIAFGRPFLSDSDAREWTALGERWRAVVAAIPIDERTFGAVHADLHQWNVLWREGRGPHVLDFALCGVGYRLYDLASFLWPRRDGTAADADIARMCDAFVRGYQSRRALYPEEMAALDVFVRLRDLWEMRDFADWDEKFDAARDVPGYLARFRAFPPTS